MSRNAPDVSAESVDVFPTKGTRLHHILDKISFKGGRGRITDLQFLLGETFPDEFGDLKYQTIKGWFGKNLPDTEKIDLIIDALIKNNYVFLWNISSVKYWWMTGVDYPFQTPLVKTEDSVNAIRTDPVLVAKVILASQNLRDIILETPFISAAVLDNSILTAKTILAVEEARITNNCSLSKEQRALINDRILGFCITNNFQPNSKQAIDAIDKILSLVIDGII